MKMNENEIKKIIEKLEVIIERLKLEITPETKLHKDEF